MAEEEELENQIRNQADLMENRVKRKSNSIFNIRSQSPKPSQYTANTIPTSVGGPNSPVLPLIKLNRALSKEKDTIKQ